MSDNKDIYNGDLEFDDEIDFDGLDDFIEEDIEEDEEDFSIDYSSETLESEEDDSLPEENIIDEEIYQEETQLEEIEYTDEEELITPREAIIKEEYPQQFESDFQYDEYKKTPVTSEETTKRNNISINKLFIINTAVSAVTLCAVAAGIALGYGYINSIENDLEIKNAEIAKLEEKNSILEADYIEAMNTFETEKEEEKTPLPENETEEGKIILYDSSVGYSWLPVLTGIQQNDYINENFIVDNRGRISYMENNEVSSYFGIDVSSYQGDIDWQLVKEDNVEFAFLRIGYRGYGEEGKLCPDEKFVANYDGAHDAGIDLGIYFFSQATSVDEAIEEANYVLSLLENRTLEYPIVFDWETVQTGDPEDIPRTEDVMPRTLTLSAIAFCETIRDAGYDAMIYTNKKLATIKYDLRMLSDYPIWLAYYDTELNYCYDFDIWQYGTGQVDGIEGEVDINVAMIK